MYSNQTPHTPGAPYVPSHGLPTPTSVGSGQYTQYANTVPNAPYMASVPLPRTPNGGYTQLPSPPESPSAPRHSPPTLGEYITPRRRISYDVRAAPVSAVHPSYLSQPAADRPFTIYIPALGNAVGVSYVSVPCHRGYPVTVQTVLECLSSHLAAPMSSQLFSSLDRNQRAAVDSLRIHERGPNAARTLRDLLHANVYFKGLSVENGHVVAHLSHQP
ncbi:unnamed protein product [Peniophora sp. CBMAI 1063]|nr:unnamed protein product [Peniophora sp. CBMAI 1063]